jgi:hypothetical protein
MKKVWKSGPPGPASVLNAGRDETLDGTGQHHWELDCNSGWWRSSVEKDWVLIQLSHSAYRPALIEQGWRSYRLRVRFGSVWLDWSLRRTDRLIR